MFKIAWMAIAVTLFLTPSPQGKPTDELEIDRQELVNLENETVLAMKLHNPGFFKRVYSEDFVGTTPSGQDLNKAEFMNLVATQPVSYDTFFASNVRVRLYEETAVVNSLWSMRGTAKGQRYSSQARVIHVYINGPHGWRVIASQETLLPGQGS